MNPIVKELIIASLIGALDVIKNLINDTRWLDLCDKILNEIESTFKEGSLGDEIAEEICKRVRNRFSIPDSLPDN